MEQLSKTFLQNVNKAETIEVNEVFKSRRQSQNRDGGHNSTEVTVTRVIRAARDRVNAKIVVSATQPGSTMPFERVVSDARGPIISRNSAKVI